MKDMSLKGVPENSTPVEILCTLEGGSGCQAPAVLSAEAVHEGVAGHQEGM